MSFRFHLAFTEIDKGVRSPAQPPRRKHERFLLPIPRRSHLVAPTVPNAIPLADHTGKHLSRSSQFEALLCKPEPSLAQGVPDQVGPGLPQRFLPPRGTC